MVNLACEVCKQPVRRDGIVGINTEHAAARFRRWEAHAREFNVGAGPHIDDTTTWPDIEQAHWYWGHAKCLPDDLDYLFEGSRIRNPKRALGWTLHLQEKFWFEHTDWEALLRRFGFVEYA